MNNDTCPHCGAERHPEGERWPVYQCGSRLDGAHRASRCYERQLAAQAAEIKRLEFDAAVGRQLTIWLRKGATITGSPTCLTRDVNGDIQGELIIKYPEGEMK